MRRVTLSPLILATLAPVAVCPLAFAQQASPSAAPSAAAAPAQPRTDPVAGELPIAGGVLHFEQRGQGSPLLLLSGGPGFANYLQPVADALSADHCCILLDQRGTGASRLEKVDAGTMTLDLAIADLEALRQHLRLERWSVLGHSWGGMLAMAYATRHADRIGDLVLVDTGGFNLEFASPFSDTLEGRATPDERTALAHWNDAAVQAQDPAAAAREKLKLRFPAYFYDRQKAQAAWPAFGAVAYSPVAFRTMMGDLQQRAFDLRSGLAALRCRTLIVHGRQDPMPETVAYQIREVLPQAELRFVEKCGHFPWLEQPDALFAELRRFLASK